MKLSELTSNEYFKSEKNIDFILKSYLNLPADRLKDVPRENRRNKFKYLYDIIVKSGQIPESSCKNMTVSEFFTLLQFSQNIAYRFEYMADDYDDCNDYFLYDSRMFMSMIRENTDTTNELYKSINLKAFLEFYKSRVKEEDREESKLISFVYGKTPYEDETIGDLLRRLEMRAFTCWVPSTKSYQKYVKFIRQTYELIDWVVCRSFMELYPDRFNEQEIVKQFCEA
jgi:hypothetical protein